MSASALNENPNHDERGRFSEGGGGTAGSASESAKSASEKADKSGDHKDHKAAQKAHEDAQAEHRKAGDEAEKSGDTAKATEHRQKAADHGSSAHRHKVEAKSRKASSMVNRTFGSGATTLTLNINESSPAEPATLMLYDTIGSDPWSGGGITAKDFCNALEAITPKDRTINLRINSKGGDVHEGLAIKNALDQWGGRVTCIIDGIAASTASWIPCGCDEVSATKNSQVFIHDAIAFGMGNAEDFRKVAANLDKTSDQIAGMYSEKTGKRANTMRQLMKAETLLTGVEAEEMGLVDTLIDTKAVRNFAPEEIGSMKNQIRAFNSASLGSRGLKDNQRNIMTKDQMMALLKSHGVKVADEATDEQLQAALEQLLKTKPQTQNAAPAVDNSAQLTALQNQIAQLTEANKTALKQRITNEIDGLITNDQLPAALKEKAIARAMADEGYLNELRALPAKPPGDAPLSSSRVECVSEAFGDVQKHIIENGDKFMKNFIGRNVDGQIGERACRDIRDHSIIVANTIRKHRDTLMSQWNTNTIDAGVQRQVIMQEMIEEFAVILQPLQSFSTVFSNVPLEGTDTVEVPFYDLAADAGNSWDPTTGYATMGNTAVAVRPVVIGGSGTTSGSSAPANTAKDRKWVGLQFSSYEMNRQPYVSWSQHAKLKANRLAVLIFSDIVSRVITTANFGAATKTVPASGFDSDAIADLWETATGLNWPEFGRSLTLNHTYKTALLKDPAFKYAYAAGDTEALRRANIRQAYGFDPINTVPNLTSYSPAGQNLVGWMNHMYAVLVATAPIMPTPDVRALMTRYDVVTDPKTGMSFEYKRQGVVVTDQTQEIIECSYGANKGLASALKWFASA